jgi:hypothetical protein
VPRENAYDKARRLLAEGRVTISFVGETEIVASVRGDSARRYTVRWDPSGWSDTCDARTSCSHIQAVQLVTFEPIGRGRAKLHDL